MKSANQTQKRGIVYILSNRCFWMSEQKGDSDFRQILKIGHVVEPTPEALKKRMKNLFGTGKTGVPLPFDLEYAQVVSNPVDVEKKLRSAFAAHRVHPKREFFWVEVESVKSALKIRPGREIKVSDDKLMPTADANAKKKWSKGSVPFSKYGIFPKDKLVSTMDKRRFVTVVDDNNVNFEGEVMSITNAGKELRKELKGNDRHIWWAFIWKHKGKQVSHIIQQEEEQD